MPNHSVASTNVEPLGSGNYYQKSPFEQELHIENDGITNYLLERDAEIELVLREDGQGRSFAFIKTISGYNKLTGTHV